MEIDGKIIGRATDYDSLVALLRQRFDSLQTTFEALDHASGLHSNYSNKLLGSVPVKSLGRVSLGPILQSLGLAILVVEDPAALARVRNRLTRRRRPSARSSEMSAHHAAV